MVNGCSQRRPSTPRRRSFSSPSSLDSLRVSGRDRRRLDDSPRSYDYQRDPALDTDGQIDGEIETVTEPLEMYEGGSRGGGSRLGSSSAPTSSNVVKIVPNQGYSNQQNDCPSSYAPGALTFPSILCIPCPCVSGPNSQNCPPTCVTYHPVDPSAAQPMSQQQDVTQMPTPMAASSVVPHTQVSHVYSHNTNSNHMSAAAQFERDHHFPPNLPPSCCGGLQLQPHHPTVLHRYESQQSCPFDPNNSFSSAYCNESPQSSCGGARGCCPSASNDYRYFAPRRRRRCRREYYLQITKGKCRTGEDDESEESGTSAGPSVGGGRAGVGRGGTAAGSTSHTRPTHFPINFRLQKASMNEPITRPALPAGRPALVANRPALPSTRPPYPNRAMPITRPALPSISYSSESSSSASKSSSASSFNDSDRSLSSVATNTSASSSDSRRKQSSLSSAVSSASAVAPRSSSAGNKKQLPPAALKPASENVDDDNEAKKEPSMARANAANIAGGKASAHVGKKLVFNTQAGKNKAKHRSLNDVERPRFGSVPFIQETAASVLRKRHNEIRMQAIREMLEKDLRRLKHI